MTHADCDGLNSTLRPLGLEVRERITCRRGTSVYKVVGASGIFALKVAAESAGSGSRYDAASVLRHEASVLRQIQHLSEGYSVDCGSGAGHYWLRTRWLNGSPASRLFEDWRAAKAADEYRTSALAAVYSFYQEAAALHEHGYIHGDLQPAHLLLEASGRVRLIDFALSKHTGDLDFPYEGGLAEFLPPEVAQKRLQRSTVPAMDPRAEVYSASAVAFTLYAGVPPVDLQSLEPCTPEETFQAIATTHARRFAEVGTPPFPRLEAVLQSGLEKTREARCPSLNAALEMLQEL